MGEKCVQKGFLGEESLGEKCGGKVCAKGVSG